MPATELDLASIVQTTNSWLSSDWYVPSIPLDVLRKISISGTDILLGEAILADGIGRKDIAEPESVKGGGDFREFLVTQRKGQGMCGLKFSSKLNRQWRRDLPDSGGTIHRARVF